MELYLLRTFVAVAREKNLTRAAEVLHLSQPAVSAHIKSLEEELGMRLFVRTAKGMSLTEEGKVLLTEAEEALSAARNLLDKARTLKGDILGTARVGTIADTQNLRLDEFFAVMAARYPHVTLQLRQSISGEVVNGVKNGELEGGFILADHDEAQLASIELQKIKLFVAAPPAWQEQIAEAGWQELAAFPWIMTPPLCSFRRITNKIFAAHRVRPRAVVEADQEPTLRMLAASGAGLALLREEQARDAEQKGELVLWGKEALETALSFIYRREREHDPIVNGLITVIRVVWGEKKREPFVA